MPSRSSRKKSSRGYRRNRGQEDWIDDASSENSKFVHHSVEKTFTKSNPTPVSTCFLAFIALVISLYCALGLWKRLNDMEIHGVDVVHLEDKFDEFIQKNPHLNSKTSVKPSYLAALEDDGDIESDFKDYQGDRNPAWVNPKVKELHERLEQTVTGASAAAAKPLSQEASEKLDALELQWTRDPRLSFDKYAKAELERQKESKNSGHVLDNDIKSIIVLRKKISEQEEQLSKLIKKQKIVEQKMLQALMM